MADDLFNFVSSADQIKANYEQFKDKFVDKDKELISQETFLHLLVAEMSNQDPLEPTSNTEFISQLAQFSSMQYMQDSSKYAMATYASSLVGKTVQASKMDGPDLIMKTGVVEKVVYKNNSYAVTIDGEDFDISKVTSVVADGSVSGGFGSNSLSDRIARAANMIGLYAYVKTGEKTEDGKDQLVEGFIESVTVKDGEINIVVDGKPYSMDSIDEVTAAYIVDDPENPDAPKDPDGTEGTEGTEGTDKTENNGGETVEAGSLEDIPENKALGDVSDLPGYEDLSPEDQELINQLHDMIGAMS